MTGIGNNLELLQMYLKKTSTLHRYKKQIMVYALSSCQI